jgi:hypothetical protein
MLAACEMQACEYYKWFYAVPWRKAVMEMNIRRFHISFYRLEAVSL